MTLSPRQALDNRASSEIRMATARRRLSKALSSIHDEMVRESPGEPTMSYLEWIRVLTTMLERMVGGGLEQEYQVETEPYVPPAPDTPAEPWTPFVAAEEIAVDRAAAEGSRQ